jgi:hypothetical protein
MDRPATPFMVRCAAHGPVFLTPNEYDDAMHRPDDLWTCPICGEHAIWDDANYEARIDKWYDDVNDAFGI